MLSKMKEYRTETVYLKRYGPKEWQYENCEIVSVELAVLDYLKDNGWQGYFTEQFDYDKLLTQMMCWKDHSAFPSPKFSDPEDIYLFPYICLFDIAKDGYWKHDAHEFTCKELINNAINFQPNDIPKILNDWNNQKAKFRKTRNGERSRKDWQKICDLQASDLISYYKASGGKEYFLGLINKKYPKELTPLWNKSSLIFQKLKVKMIKDGTFYGRSDMANNHFDLYHKIGSFLGVHSPVLPISELNDQIEEISKLSNTDPRYYYLDLLIDIKKLTNKLGTLTFQDRIGVAAYLDLKIWKNGQCASVEVKAPRDRLRPNQKEQLDLDINAGYLSWVINVKDLNEVKKKADAAKKLADDIKSDWKKGFEFYSHYISETDILKVPSNVIYEGFKLGKWVKEQRTSYRKGKLTPDQKKALDDLGFLWEIITPLKDGLAIYMRYVKETGDIQGSIDIFEDFKLSKWVGKQRLKYRNNELSSDRIEALNNLDFIWDLNDFAWMNRFNSYSNYVKETGNTQVSKNFMYDGFNLSKWLSKQREAYSKNTIKTERRNLLDDLGFVSQPATGIHITK